MACAETAAGTLRVELVYCPAPGHCDCVTLTLPPGSRVADALQRSDVLARHGLVATGLHVGIWGRTQPPERLLRDRDRVEIYRPLTVDPKEARRQRYQQHRDKAAPARKG